jgi:hypothetical protein
MATNPTAAQYMAGRKKYGRPQAMLWSENSGTLSNKLYLPNGYEVGAQPATAVDQSLLNQFLILSDDNRGEITIDTNRIEKRERMINGRMRSYHVADKLNISTSWNMLPSRAFALSSNFNPVTGKSEYTGLSGKPSSVDMQYTTDGGAGGVEMLDWYENHQGSFWVYLSYDKHSNFGKNNEAYGHLQNYNQIVEMFFSSFQYTVVKRGNSNYDFWNISVTLEEA